MKNCFAIAHFSITLKCFNISHYIIFLYSGSLLFRTFLLFQEGKPQLIHFPLMWRLQHDSEYEIFIVIITFSRSKIKFVLSISNVLLLLGCGATNFLDDFWERKPKKITELVEYELGILARILATSRRSIVDSNVSWCK